MSDLTWTIVCVFGFLLVVLYIHRVSKLHMRRAGWDAHKHGLRRNPAWGRDCTRGWDERAEGLDRP